MSRYIFVKKRLSLHNIFSVSSAFLPLLETATKLFISFVRLENTLPPQIGLKFPELRINF